MGASEEGPVSALADVLPSVLLAVAVSLLAPNRCLKSMTPALPAATTAAVAPAVTTTVNRVEVLLMGLPDE
jgi:hypothetical protein